jgi:hypothetical protein
MSSYTHRPWARIDAPGEAKWANPTGHYHELVFLDILGGWSVLQGLAKQMQSTGKVDKQEVDRFKKWFALIFSGKSKKFIKEYKEGTKERERREIEKLMEKLEDFWLKLKRATRTKNLEIREQKRTKAKGRKRGRERDRLVTKGARLLREGESKERVGRVLVPGAGPEVEAERKKLVESAGKRNRRAQAK